MKNQSVEGNEIVSENHKAHPIDAVYDERDRLRDQVRRLRKTMAELRKDKALLAEKLQLLDQAIALGNLMHDTLSMLPPSKGDPVTAHRNQKAKFLVVEWEIFRSRIEPNPKTTL